MIIMIAYDSIIVHNIMVISYMLYHEALLQHRNF